MALFCALPGASLDPSPSPGRWPALATVAQEERADTVDATPSLARMSWSSLGTESSPRDKEPAPNLGPVWEEGFGPKFRRAWFPITGGELALLGITATLPKSWTGWSNRFVAEGAAHFKTAWTRPPIMDDDHWFHNYVGHPYGGSLYFNSVRSQGATVRQSVFMSAVLSTQWEYLIEAVAERPSIQDLVITPIIGSALGELIHSATLKMKRGGTTLPEKALILVLNPMHAIFAGLGGIDEEPSNAAAAGEPSLTSTTPP